MHLYLILNSYFYEEAYTTDTNELVYLLIEDDSTFVHGKVYRKQFLLGKYFLESSLIDYHLLRYSPSVIGISCVYIVMKFFGFENYRELYSKKMVNEKQPQKVIKDAARDICFLVRNLHTSHLTAVKNKYSLPENLNVAHYCDQE